MNARKHIVVKKAKRWFYDSFRHKHDEYIKPPLLLNSIPKSGTHLLHQITHPLGLNDYAGFIASTPSFTMVEKPALKIVDRLTKLYENELVLGHIFFSDDIENLIIDYNIPTLFIYRDPRDILLSEINYLSNMNKYHRLHKYFKAAHSEKEKFNLALNGIETDKFYYPPFNERISRYINWLESSATYPIKFEDLRDKDKQLSAISGLSDYFKKYNLWLDSSDYLTALAIKSIDPKKSHTFSGGKVERWKKEFTKNDIEVVNKKLNTVIEKLGYGF